MDAGGRELRDKNERDTGNPTEFRSLGREHVRLGSGELADFEERRDEAVLVVWLGTDLLGEPPT